jgi:hypothetical protein
MKKPSKAKFLSSGVGIASTLLGTLVLIGWYTQNVKLIQVNPAFVPMQYNTALGFFLSGIAMLLIIANRKRSVGILGIIVIGIGLITIIEYALGLVLFIDQLFMKHYVTVKTSHPGRMAPNTALCFSLTGLAALFSFLREKKEYMSGAVGVFGALIFGLGLIAFSGYFIGVEAAYGWGELTRMAVHTAFGFMILGSGYMAVAWHLGGASISALPRRLPIHVGLVAIALTLVLWQALHTQETNLTVALGAEAANIADDSVLLFGVSLSVVLAISIYLMQLAQRRSSEAVKAYELSRAEIKERKRAEAELRQHRDKLEVRVKERTRELEQRNIELELALSDVKTLSGLLPICAGCKNIRDDKGYWNRIESYISDHSEADFTHGICPDCAEELYPEVVHNHS